MDLSGLRDDKKTQQHNLFLYNLELNSLKLELVDAVVLRERELSVQVRLQVWLVLELLHQDRVDRLLVLFPLVADRWRLLVAYRDEKGPTPMSMHEYGLGTLYTAIPSADRYS
jgi:hypothetical protein